MQASTAQAQQHEPPSFAAKSAQLHKLYVGNHNRLAQGVDSIDDDRHRYRCYTIVFATGAILTGAGGAFAKHFATIFRNPLANYGLVAARYAFIGSAVYTSIKWYFADTCYGRIRRLEHANALAEMRRSRVSIEHDSDPTVPASKLNDAEWELCEVLRDIDTFLPR